MNFKLLNLFILIVVNNIATSINAQSFRGMHVEKNNKIWVSGNRGMVLQTGKNPNQWDTISPNNRYKTKDFRDLHVVNDSTILIMSSGDSGIVLRTDNYGKDWSEVLTDNRKGIFFDVIEIDNETGIGILLGDALKYTTGVKGDSVSYLVGYFTLDHGKTWSPLNNGTWNQATDKMNALFAASGSSCAIINSELNTRNKTAKLDFCFAGGGKLGTEFRLVSLELKNSDITKTKLITSNVPLPTGEGWGIYSLSKTNSNTIFLVGGNWKEPYSNSTSGFLININARKKKIVSVNEVSSFSGYYSGSANKDSLFIGVGTKGMSIWNGKITKTLSVPNLNVCKFSDDYLWFAGSKGVIDKIKIADLSRL